MNIKGIKWTLALHILAIIFIFLSDHQAKAQGITSQRRQFLFNLGFEDYSAKIKQALDKGHFEHELNRRQMIRNALMYESINASRELALFIYNFLDQDEMTTQKNRVLVEFTAKMLALKPLAPSIDFPPEILKMTESDREVAIAQWLEQQRRLQMENHLRRIISDIQTLLESSHLRLSDQDLAKIYKLTSVIVDRMYLDDMIGNSRFFGRSLLALMAREEKIGHYSGSSIMKSLALTLKERYNLRIENFIGDTMVFESKSGERRVQIREGTEMLTKNLSFGSLQISIAAFPKNLMLRWQARFKGLVGNPLAAPFYVKAKDLKEGIELKHRVNDLISQGESAIQSGFSHIVYYQVKEDFETGIKMPRVIHNIPSAIADLSEHTANTGGVIITYPEQVIDRSRHSQVYFSHFNADKFKTTAEKYIQKFGYNPEFFTDTLKLELSPEGMPVNSEQAVAKPWKTKISENEFKMLHAEKDATKWSQIVLKKFTQTLENFSLRGVTFHWPDPYDFYILDSAYCSQTGEMAMQEAANIPLEMEKSDWHWGIRALAKIGAIAEYLEQNPAWRRFGSTLKALPGVEKSMKLTNIKIIAPNNLAIQRYMDGEKVVFKSLNLEQRFSAAYGNYREFDESRTRLLEARLPRGNPKFNIIQEKFTDPIRSYAAALREIEYSLVMRASQGLTTNIDIDTLAEEGGRLGDLNLTRYKKGLPRCEGVFIP